MVFWHYNSLPQQANKTEFPTLFSIAMDYLPVQATSVSCERVFSSSKDTDTAKRNQNNSVLMEALQMLKHSLKKERLNFMDGWRTSEAAMSEMSKAGNLSSFFVDDPEFPSAALDTLLKNLKDDDCES
jgi:hAT family C-terminal dimerisation region